MLHSFNVSGALRGISCTNCLLFFNFFISFSYQWTESDDEDTDQESCLENIPDIPSQSPEEPGTNSDSDSDDLPDI